MQKSKWIAGVVLGATAVIAGATFQCALLSPAWCAEAPGYLDTPMLPGDNWHVHDSRRPQPAVVDPGTPSTQEQPGRPPSDAVVLFNGTDLAQWRDSKGNASGWVLRDGAMIVPPKDTPGGGDIITRQEFGDMQLHLEWSEPEGIQATSQNRGNSGVFLMGRYEIQILDSYQNPTYADGGAASLYGQNPPLVNATRPPGQWQMYDIFFTAPRFDGEKLLTPAYVTVVHNGVLVQNHTAILGNSGHRSLPKYSPTGPSGPIRLQDHANPVRFRNIWVRPITNSNSNTETSPAAE